MDDFARCSCGAAYYAATDRWTDPATGASQILAYGQTVDACPSCMTAALKEQKPAPLTSPPVRVYSTSSEEGAKLREEYLQQEREKAEAGGKKKEK